MKKLVKIKGKLGNKKGFTLVEMIIVMVIMALLAVALIPTMMGFIKDAKQSQDLATARSYYVAAQSAATYMSGKQEAPTSASPAAIIASEKYKELVAGLPAASCTIVLEDGEWQIKSIQVVISGRSTVTLTPNDEAKFT